MKKMIFLVMMVLLLTGCGAAVPEPESTVAVLEAAVINTAETTVPVETEPREERFLLTFVGDCTFGANPHTYHADVGFPKTVGKDYAYPFRNVLEYFENDELTCINLEGTLCDEGRAVNKKYTFRGPTEYVRIMTENSVEFVTLANNHTMDYGEKGYTSTIETLEAARIPYVEQDKSTVITTKNGLTIGFYGAVYYRLDEKTITSEIRALAEQEPDLVIFAPHWGSEGSFVPSFQQEKLGRAAIDAGADIVWGSHPHVLQSIEEYNGGVIFYSLGNFSFGGNTVPKDLDTAILQQEVIRNTDGQIRLGELHIIPASVSSVAGRNNFQPTPYVADTEEYDRVLRKLSGTYERSHIPIN